MTEGLITGFIFQVTTNAAPSLVKTSFLLQDHVPWPSHVQWRLLVELSLYLVLCNYYQIRPPDCSAEVSLRSWKQVNYQRTFQVLVFINIHFV